jgi:NAD+ diphosphatase
MPKRLGNKLGFVAHRHTFEAKEGTVSKSLNLPLARSAVDRDYLQRKNPNLFDELWANPKTRVLAMHQGKILLHQNGDKNIPQLKLFEVESIPSATLRVYLGVSTDDSAFEPAGTPIVLAELSTSAANQLESDEGAWISLRRNGAGLSDRDAGLYAQSLSIANWHESHTRCSKCGTPTVVIDGGWVRTCVTDEKEFYPRTDPAIIAAITDDQDRLLMGSQGIWEDNRWSVLAGFVEPGESLAAAVEREIFEEAGVRVTEIDYLGSQSWPFPYSLMVGFKARARGEQQLVPDLLEIEKLRWFSREELAKECSDILLPGRLSIARALIEDWFGGEIVSASELKG